MIDKISCCPECGHILHFMDGAIDPEWSCRDFLYCDNPDCNNRNGYDPADFVDGTQTIVAYISRS